MHVEAGEAGVDRGGEVFDMNGPEFDDLKQHLRALAEADAQLSAPPRVEHALLLEIFTDKGIGTEISM